MISLDTETTGVDFQHGARPFFLTSCDDGGEVTFFEWKVDPLTRAVDIPPEDLDWLRNQLDVARSWGKGYVQDVSERHVLVLQNPKFDVAALTSVGVTNWPWGMTRDTLMAGHLLASNLPHDLYSMAYQYLPRLLTKTKGNLRGYEDRLGEITKHARRLCRRKGFIEKHGEWAIAEHGRPDMPSCPKSKKNKTARGNDKDASWKFDTWLPKTLYDALGPDELGEWIGADPTPWESVLREYANVDSEITLLLWKVMRERIRERNLWPIYRERLKVLPVTYAMESYGLTLSKSRLEEISGDFCQGSEDAAAVCTNTAEDLGFELTLPAGGSNNSLREFAFDVLKLEPLRNPKAKTNAPSLDKNAIAHYLATLYPRSPAYAFVRNLAEKRVRDTAVGFMKSYRSFWVNTDDPIGDTKRLYPRMNPTGTDTLRFSHENPNSANISKKDDFNVRYCFGPGPGREFWSFDAKGIEDRLPAYRSGQQELIDIFERADEPPFWGSNHFLRFSIVYPEIWAAAIKEVGLEKAGPYCKKRYAATYYQWCKNGGFAVQYGAVEKASGWGTADLAFHREGAHALLKERLSKLEDYNQYWIRFANKNGYVETIPDRTVDPDRGYPLLCTRTGFGKVLETVPLNYHIQGSAMWWTCKAMVRVYEFFEFLNDGRKFLGRTWPGGYYITMQVHDELVNDMPSGRGRGANPWEYNLPVAREVQRLMALGGGDFNIPTPVGVEYNEVSWDKGVAV